MTTLFVSDLHLPETASPLRDTFHAFLKGPARTAAAVYLLGDLFEYWIGDDVGTQRYADEVNALRDLTQRGVMVYFVGGNRDFIVGREFFRDTGVQPLPDPYVADIEGVRTLLSHGDVFCTDDRGYQRWRRFSRIPNAQRAFMALPLRWRRGFGDSLRSHSQQARSYRPSDILDVNAGAIERAFARSAATRMIHGHTHRPCVHQLDVDGIPRERIVLADWRPDTQEYLQVERDGYRRRQVRGA